jgi:N-acyl-D-amino-acid deacylase
VHDLVVRGGTVVDATGAPGRVADVSISGGVITEIGSVDGAARKTVDATDLVVSPGFIDPHTHYDAQICWDQLVTPSSWHGVTSVVMGNCGVGIAPCKPAAHEISTWDLVTVEAIPYDILEAGITWDWETFPEYMDRAEQRRYGINLGFLAPLTPFRHFVMGEESMARSATPEETAQVKALLSEAVGAGALGFSTTRMANHVGYRGLPLACRQADLDELRAYCNALRELGKGCIELALTANNSVVTEEEHTLLRLLLEESGRPVTWLSLFDRDDLPDAAQESLRYTDDLAALGARGQIATRPLTVNIDLRHPWIFTGMSCFPLGADAGEDDRRRVYADPSFRAAFRDELTAPHLFTGYWDRASVHEVGDPARADTVGRTVADLAAERHAHPVDVFFDLALDDDLRTVFSYDLMNVTEERIPALLNDSRTLIGLSDAGAHTDMLCDAGYCSYLLGHWVREREALPLERAVARLTSEPADFLGLHDRGRLTVGRVADLAIFDPTTIGSGRKPVWRHDFPAGGKRLVMPVTGVHATVVNGVVLYEDGEHTGALPGQVLRSQAA